jgi:hypothetical protein
VELEYVFDALFVHFWKIELLFALEEVNHRNSLDAQLKERNFSQNPFCRPLYNFLRARKLSDFSLTKEFSYKSSAKKQYTSAESAILCAFHGRDSKVCGRLVRYNAPSGGEFVREGATVLEKSNRNQIIMSNTLNWPVIASMRLKQ